MNQIWGLLHTKLPITVMDDLVRFTPSTIEQYRLVQNYLSENKIKSFHMNPKAGRPRKIVLKGIFPDTPTSEIHKNLSDHGYSVQRVTQLKKSLRDSHTKKPLPIFLCNIFPTKNFQTIYSLVELGDYSITVESYRNTRPRQCYNCQRFNHSSDNCLLDPRCLKCAGPHKTNNCPKTRDTPPKCANCGLAHTANYQGCSKNPLQIRSNKPRTNKTDTRSPKANIVPSAMFSPSPSSNIPITSSKTYANIVSNNSHPTIPTNGFAPNQINSNTIANLEKVVALLERINILCSTLKLDASFIFQNINTIDKSIPNNPNNVNSTKNT